MKTLIRGTLLLAIVALWAGSAVPLSAATTIFDNSVNDLSVRFNPGTYEVGDEIQLASTERYLTDFSFEFWGVNTASPTSFAGAVEARVRFYENTGALDPFNGYPSPSPTSFFDSGWFSVPSPTSRSTFEFTAGADFPTDGLFIPTSDMTWSVQFQGMGATDSVGVDIYSPTVVGGDYYDYWQNAGTGWTSMTNTVPMDFAARMEAVPEPSMLAISLAGGLGILTMLRRLRRTS
jgi:hypothetical protein